VITAGVWWPEALATIAATIPKLREVCPPQRHPRHREKGLPMPAIARSHADRGALSGLLAGVSFVGGVAGAMALADLPFPRPGADPAQVRKYFTQDGGRPARLSAAGQAISAAALGRFTASVAKLAHRAGLGSPALVAVAGGGLAAASLATSAVTHTTLTLLKEEDDDRAAALARRAFVAGGPVHGVGFGVLTGVLALAGLRTGELPRPVAIAGLASAALGVLSPLYFVWEPAGWLIPAGRFSGLLVSGIAGVRLARGTR
jgi:hypothetical protein